MHSTIQLLRIATATALLSLVPHSIHAETHSDQDPENGLTEGWNSYWFGNFNTELFFEYGWIWHHEHGWVFPLEENWSYNPGLGWIWTSEDIYPVVFRLSDRAWLWYFRGTTEPREIHNYSTGELEFH
ncbi:MAG: hypothetical protein JJU20_09355 [Opitutales bacterium]|nr:hypothetical protein [Opitutales bacterium]